MGELIDTVEARLLRQESVHARQPTDLGNLTREAKCVWQPRRRRSEPKLGLEKALPVQELANERLSAGKVGVMLDPRSPDGLELAGLDLGLHSLPAIWIELLEPRELESRVSDVGPRGRYC